MTWHIDTPLCGGCRFVLTTCPATYQAWAARGARVFMLEEALALIDSQPSREELTWALIQKKLKPGIRIVDASRRVSSFN